MCTQCVCVHVWVCVCVFVGNDDITEPWMSHLEETVQTGAAWWWTGRPLVIDL